MLARGRSNIVFYDENNIKKGKPVFYENEKMANVLDKCIGVEIRAMTIDKQTPDFLAVPDSVNGNKILNDEKNLENLIISFIPNLKVNGSMISATMLRGMHFISLNVPDYQEIIVSESYVRPSFFRKPELKLRMGETSTFRLYFSPMVYKNHEANKYLVGTVERLITLIS